MISLFSRGGDDAAAGKSPSVTSQPDELVRLRRKLRSTKSSLRTVRETLRKTRESAGVLRDRIERQGRELDALRSTTLEVFPGLEVSAEVNQVMDAVRAEQLTLLEARQLRSLVSCVVELEQSGREGIIIEAGTARGGSAIAMAAAKDPKRPMRVYDVFATIPPPGVEDGEDVQERYRTIEDGKAVGPGGELYYGYRDDLFTEVTDSFARHGSEVEANSVTLVKGMFEETLIVDEPVALAHVDGDWYSSTMTCLKAIAPHVVPGGRIVIDDYFTWSGCRTAVDEFFADRSDFRLEMRAKVHAVRVGG